METDFLRQFSKRMKKVGTYALLFRNSMAKTTWKHYDFLNYDEQVNLIFTMMLFIMEKSLKEEPCTIDDIGNFLDQLNRQYFHKNLSVDDCKELAKFMVNVIFCNEGQTMYFNGFNYQESKFEEIYVSFVGNSIIYLDNDVKRTSYYLTENGYELLLSTLEVDSHLKLTIQEMIFQLHLEKANYDKAVEDVKQIFNLLRMQIQKIKEAKEKIRKNVLLYKESDYEELVGENLDRIQETRNKLAQHWDYVKKRVYELEIEEIGIENLGSEQQEQLSCLKIIENYLSRGLDEFQQILTSHFNLKSLYAKELQALLHTKAIKRFNLRNEIYHPIMENPTYLENLHDFLLPLFVKKPDKIYNLNKAIEFQQPLIKPDKEEEFFTLDEEIDEETWIKEKQERLLLYRDSLNLILSFATQAGGVSLQHLQQTLSNADLNRLIPTVEIFKELMMELLQEKEIDLNVWKTELIQNIIQETWEFELSRVLLDLIEQEPQWSNLNKISITRIKDTSLTEAEEVCFLQVKNEQGQFIRIRCTNVLIKAQ